MTTCVAAPKPARWNTTVSGEAATLSSVRALVSIFRKRWPGKRSTVGGRKERGILIVNAQSNRQHRKDVEDDNAEERRADGARDGLVGACTLSSRDRNELDTAVRVKRIDEGLRKRAEPADERLSVVEVGQAL